MKFLIETQEETIGRMRVPWQKRVGFSETFSTVGTAIAAFSVKQVGTLPIQRKIQDLLGTIVMDSMSESTARWASMRMKRYFKIKEIRFLS